MAKSKGSEFGLTQETIKQVGVQKALSLFASNGVEKMVLLNKDGSVVAVQLTYNKVLSSPTTINLQYPKGDFSDIVLIKRGQAINIDKEIKITSKSEGGFIENVIEFVRQKLSMVEGSLGFLDNTKIIIGKNIDDLIPKAETADIYSSTILPDFFKKRQIVEPKKDEDKLTDIKEKFQIVVAKANKEIDLEGNTQFMPSSFKTLLLIEVSPSQLGNADDCSHRISVFPLGMKGNKMAQIGMMQKFNWKMTDVSVTPDQLVTFNAADVSDVNESDEEDAE